MKRALIVVAPFGFGPASKALTIADYLRDRYHVAFASSGSPVEFIRTWAPQQATVFSGIFKNTFATRSSLNEFDCFLAVNQLPAITHLGELGLAGRSILVDSLAQWRAESCASPLPKDLLAYIVQDELKSHARSPLPAGAVVTAPILWPDNELVPLSRRKGVLLHVGGMTSPVARLDHVTRIVTEFIGPLVDLMAEANQQITILGNTDVLQSAAFDSKPRLLANVSPKEAIHEIGHAKLLVTTPGIGAIYEAMSKGTPTVLLPPMNSTQSRHYQVLTEMGIPGVLAPCIREDLVQKLGALPWTQQTPFLLKIISNNTEALLKMSRSAISPLLSAERELASGAIVEKMTALWSSLSRTSPRSAVIDALGGIG